MFLKKALLIVVILATTASYSLAGEHPCLLFSSSDVNFIRERIQSGTPQMAWDELLNHQGAHYLHHDPWIGGSRGRHEYNCVAKLGFLYLIDEDPVMADSFGNRAVYGICDSIYFKVQPTSPEVTHGSGPLDDILDYSAMLSGFAFCYDYCYDLMSDSLRQVFRDTIKSRMDMIERRHLGMSCGPAVDDYWNNTSAQANGALGLGVIVLDGEMVQGEIYDGEARWDTCVVKINRYLQELFDTDGSGFEGCLYSSFGLSGVVPFMEALKRKTGQDMFQENEGILSKMSDWFAYEVLPEKHKYNNLSESFYWDFDPHWSEHVDGHWGYSLCWGPLEGIYNEPVLNWTFKNLIDFDDINRRTSECGSLPLIILKYNDDLASEDPVERLPLSKHFQGRGLVYFRTGWGPEEIMFSLECGPAYNPATGHYSVRNFHCDKNHFTLYAYGERFAIDTGKKYGAPRNHNVILIDGQGQCCEYAPWMTAGMIEEQVSGSFCDYVHGDATDAYNRMWIVDGHGGARDTTVFNNPVLNADRMVTFVRGDGLPPYFVIADDINKDNAVHQYQWLLHTKSGNWFDWSGNPIVLHGSHNDMNIHVISPSDFYTTQSMYVPEFTPSPLFGEDSLPPDTTQSMHPILRIKCDTINPYCQIVLFPHKAGLEDPTVTAEPITNGRCAKLAWSTTTDYNILKTTGVISEDWFSTDAKVCLIREDLDSTVTRFMMAEGTNLWMRDILLVDTFGDTGSVINSGAKVVIHSKTPHQFKVYAPQATELVVNDASVGFYRIGDYIYYPGIAGLIAEDATLSGMIQVSGDVTVDSGVTLTIQPGAQVLFTAGADNQGSGVDTTLCELIVEGNLDAQGTNTQPVTLSSTSSNQGDWWGIRFKQGSWGLLKHAVVEYGYCGVLADSGSVVAIDSCTIQKNEVYGVRCDHTDGATIVEKSWIKDNGVYGIWTDHCSPAILDNLINGSRYGIKASYAGSDMLIKGNNIDNASIQPKDQPPYDNYVGISLQNSSPIILNNEISGGNGFSGLSCSSGSNPMIKGCIIETVGKKGISCYDGSSPTVDSTQVHSYTEKGIYCYQSSYPRLGDTGIEGSGGNSIYSRDANYEVWCEENLYPVMAESCWWGTASPDPSRFWGDVDYLPCLDHDPFPDVGVEDGPEKKLPTRFDLAQNYPNPFNPTTLIRYTVPDRDREERPRHTTLKVYNILGQLVRTLVDGEQAPGYYSVRWDGRDNLGKDVSSGIYFYRLKAGEFVKTRKMVVLR